MPRICLGLTLAVLALAGCTPKKEDTGGPGERALALRPGAVLLHDAGMLPWNDPRVPGTEPRDLPFVGQVARDGNRFLVSFGVEHRGIYLDTTCSGSGPRLAVSEDGGATWATHAFPAPDARFTLETTAPFNCAPPVQAAGGQLALLFTDLDVVGNQRHYPQPVSLASNGYGTLGTPMFACRPTGEGATVRCYACVHQDDRDPSSPLIDFDYSFNVATGSQVNRSGASCLGSAVSWVEVNPAEFVTFESQAVNPVTQPGVYRWCRTTTRLGGAGGTACVPMLLWPAWAPPGTTTLATSRGPMALGGGTDGRVYATDVAPGAAGGSPTPVVVDLGPGTLHTGGFYLEMPFGPFVRIDGADGAQHLLDLRPDGGLEEVRLPGSPCLSDAACGGQAEHLWAFPLGGDEFLDVYRVDTFVQADPGMYGTTGAHRYQLYAVRDRATRSVAVLPPPPEHPASSIVEANALERVCLRASACFPSWNPLLCAQSWLQVRTASPAADTAYQAFLATPPGDCAAFRTTWPVVGTYPTGGCGAPGGSCSGYSRCVGDVLVNDAWLYDCSAVGARCQAVSPYLANCGSSVASPVCGTCDAAGNAVACGPYQPRLVVSRCAALGMTCVAGASSLPAIGAVGHYCSAGTCPPGVARQCAGTVAFTCTADGQVTEQSDCARLGLECRDGACRGTGTACDGNTAAQCIGATAVWCTGGTYHQADCAALGLTGCTASFSIARCTP